MTEIQGSQKTIRIFDTFSAVADLGSTVYVAGIATAVKQVPRSIGNGSFRLVGQGIAETDSGAAGLDTDGLNGVLQLTTTDENQHSCGIETARMFDVALMGSLTAEARVRIPTISNLTVFMGFCDLAVANYVPSIEVDLCDVTAATTLDPGGSANTATAFAGFFLNTELTSSSEWHAPYMGGSASAPTGSNSVDLNVNATGGDWDILRVTIRPSGAASWYVNNKLLQTVVGAISTTTDLKFWLAVESKTTAVKTLDVDYVKIYSGHDHTV